MWALPLPHLSLRAFSKGKAFCVIAQPERSPWLPAPSDRGELRSLGAWGRASLGLAPPARGLSVPRARTCTYTRARARTPTRRAPPLRVFARPQSSPQTSQAPQPAVGTRAAPCPSGNRPAPPATGPCAGASPRGWQRDGVTAEGARSDSWAAGRASPGPERGERAARPSPSREVVTAVAGVWRQPLRWRG